MKWRVLVLLGAGIAMIYLVSLLQDAPYPHPVIVQASVPKRSRINEPSEVILGIHGDYIYRTHVYFEAVTDNNRGFVHGVGSIKTGVNGVVTQARKKKQDFLSEMSAEEDWQMCFQHLFNGPISKISKSIVDNGPIQFAVLYHVIENHDIQHFVRVYYVTNNNTSEYKDLLLTGNTMVNAISLEHDSILFSRDPDIYRFRIVALPDHLLSPPHSEHSSPILLNVGQMGDIVKVYHQPKETESHIGLLCRLYSPNPNTYRVLSLDIHKTKHIFHTNVTIADGTTTLKKQYPYQVGKWVYRDHLHSQDKAIIDENLEYMAFAEVGFHQERTIINMPKPTLSRSRDGKTMVVSLIRNNFQTLDYTDKLDAVEKRYRTTEDDVQEFYHSMQAVDSVEPNETSAYDPTDIRGMQVDQEGILLAIWTESNSIYIYKRGAADVSSGMLTATSPHYLERPLEWILRMVITPSEGQIGSITPIGATLFWNHEGSNYISVGMKNDIVNTYLIDETEEQQAVNFKSFIRDKWDLWVVMSFIVAIFTIYEYKTYPN